MTEVAVQLDRSPRSGGAARQFVRGHLLRAGADDLVETAELVVTELVTNVLVHTDQVPVVRLHLGAECVRVTVEDGCPALPAAGVLDLGAVSGRGLLLVEAMVHRWGVSRTAGVGKGVWFELARDGAAPEVDLDADRLLELWTDELDPEVEEIRGPEPAEARPLCAVRLAGVSAALLHDTKSHLDDLVRDLTLVHEAAQETGAGDPALVDLAARLTGLVGRLSGFRSDMRRQALAATREGAETLTLELELPVDLAGPLVDYRHALDEADEHCVAGRLLVAPAPEALATFRRWKLDTIACTLRENRPPAV